MPSIFATVALLAAISQALTIPTPKRTFSVPRVAVGGRETISGAYQRAIRKYSDSVAKVSSVGAVTATPIGDDGAWVCPVTVGSDVLLLDFDTGSSDLWVFSTQSPGASDRAAYNPTTGTLQVGQSWNIRYGDNSSAAGVVYSDTVTVGGATVTSQAVEAATSVSAEFLAFPADGLLGLGWENGNECSPNKCQTFFGNLQSSLPAAVFTADIQPYGGSYDFGYIDSSKYCGNITYTDVLGQFTGGYWDFEAGASSLNSSGIGYSIMDTGTSLWLLDSGLVQAFYNDTPSAQQNQTTGSWSFSCQDTLPDVSVDIGGTTFTVLGSALNHGPVSEGSDICAGGIQPTVREGFNIFGDVFMRNFLVVFDMGNARVGIANQSPY